MRSHRLLRSYAGHHEGLVLCAPGSSVRPLYALLQGPNLKCRAQTAHDPDRKHQQAERPSDPVHRRVDGDPEGREGLGRHAGRRGRGGCNARGRGTRACGAAGAQAGVLQACSAARRARWSARFWTAARPAACASSTRGSPPSARCRRGSTPWARPMGSTWVGRRTSSAGCARRDSR